MCEVSPGCHNQQTSPLGSPAECHYRWVRRKSCATRPGAGFSLRSCQAGLILYSTSRANHNRSTPSAALRSPAPPGTVEGANDEEASNVTAASRADPIMVNGKPQIVSPCSLKRVIFHPPTQPHGLGRTAGSLTLLSATIRTLLHGMCS